MSDLNIIFITFQMKSAATTFAQIYTFSSDSKAKLVGVFFKTG